MPGPLPVAWLNGAFVPLADARISPLDRGFLFGDAAYEVVPVYGGRPFLFVEHMQRLERSLGAIGMHPPLSLAAWAPLLEELVARNGGGDQYLYVQVSRGAEFGRNHAPAPSLEPTIFLMAAALPPLDAAIRSGGVSAITLPDHRWKRCDIKSTALLANVLAKGQAANAGATEAILVADGMLREGSSSSVMIIKDGTIGAPPDGPEILPSTTRELALRLAPRCGIAARVAPITEAQLREADEILIAFATRGVLAVTRLDGQSVGDGRPGPVWTQLHAAFEAYRQEVAGTPLLESVTAA